MGLLEEHGGGGSKRPRAPWVFSVLAAAATGTIVTANLDGATVRADGRVVGPAPRRVDGVPAGSHRVRVEKEGFPPHDRDVHVKALTLKLRSGRTYNFAGSPDALLVFQQKLEKARPLTP